MKNLNICIVINNIPTHIEDFVSQVAHYCNIGHAAIIDNLCNEDQSANIISAFENDERFESLEYSINDYPLTFGYIANIYIQNHNDTDILFVSESITISEYSIHELQKTFDNCNSALMVMPAYEEDITSIAGIDKTLLYLIQGKKGTYSNMPYIIGQCFMVNRRFSASGTSFPEEFYTMEYAVKAVSTSTALGTALIAYLPLCKQNIISNTSYTTYTDNDSITYANKYRNEIVQKSNAFNTQVSDALIDHLNSKGFDDDAINYVASSSYLDCLYGQAGQADVNRILNITRDNQAFFWLPIPEVGKYVTEYEKIPLQKDSNCGLYYIMYLGKRMYFPSTYSVERIKSYITWTLLEQEPGSPHNYHKEGYMPSEGDVLLDIGVAEGNFTLEYIDTVSHAYLVEPDEEWLEALNETFKDYKDKITIIPKFMSDHEDENNITIDALAKDIHIDYIKMDIEGYEEAALRGAVDTLKKQKPKLAVASYHKSDCERYIKEFFYELKGYELDTSEGYIIAQMNFNFWTIESFIFGDLRKGITFVRPS